MSAKKPIKAKVRARVARPAPIVIEAPAPMRRPEWSPKNPSTIAFAVCAAVMVTAFAVKAPASVPPTSLTITLDSASIAALKAALTSPAPVAAPAAKAATIAAPAAKVTKHHKRRHGKRHAKHKAAAPTSTVRTVYVLIRDSLWF